MSRADRERRPGRRPAFRDQRPKLLIVCEGENTEKQYFDQFVKHHRTSLVDVKVSDEHDKSIQAIRIAKRLKAEAEEAAKRESDPNLKYDSVWCVFDVDEHPLLAEAAEMARKNGIKIALSNPCFELWLFLHLKDSPGSLHRHKMQSLLKNSIKHYDKNVDLNHYNDGYDTAVERAKKLDEQAEKAGTPGMNPTTGVYKLTEIIIPPKPKEPPRKVVKRHNR